MSKIIALHTRTDNRDETHTGNKTGGKYTEYLRITKDGYYFGGNPVFIYAMFTCLEHDKKSVRETIKFLEDGKDFNIRLEMIGLTRLRKNAQPVMTPDRTAITWGKQKWEMQSVKITPEKLEKIWRTMMIGTHPDENCKALFNQSALTAIDNHKLFIETLDHALKTEQSANGILSETYITDLRKYVACEINAAFLDNFVDDFKNGKIFKYHGLNL